MEKHRLEWAQKWIQAPKTSWIGIEPFPSENAGEFSAINPSTGEKITQLHLAGSKTVNAAVQSARAAFESAQWKGLHPKERAQSLNRIAAAIRAHHAELATLETFENGKLYRESFEDDIPEAADVFEYYAGWATKIYGETCPTGPAYLNYTVREPLGVCALVVPWNFPFLLACWKISACLSMGNTAIVKPSPQTSSTLLRLMEILTQEKILPPGVLNVVLGGSATGDLLSSHSGIDKISFTGSTSVGKRIVRQSGDSNLKAVTLELGGKSANILFDDTPDLEFALERSFYAMFCHKGEKCSEPTRLFVHQKHYTQTLDFLSRKCEAVRCGDPFDPASDQGPQCTREQFEKILSYIEIGKKEGARLIAGGSQDTTGKNSKGFFVRPTVFADVHPQMKIAQDEIFGPVLAVTPFTSEAEVVEMANSTIYGLAAGLWSSDISRAHRVASQLDAGMVFINRYGCYDFASPFGGFRQSGWGKEMSRDSLNSYTKTKSIWVKL